MKFKNHLKEQEYIENFIIITELANSSEVNEMSKKTVEYIKQLGKKFGVRVKPSESIFTYLKRFGKGMDDLFRIASLYLLTDIKDRESRRQLEQDAKEVLKKVKKKELIAFLIQLDKLSFGLTAHFRHFFQSVLGLEIATYNKWMEDKEYIEKEVRHIKNVMKRMGLENSKEMILLNNFQNSIETILD